METLAERLKALSDPTRLRVLRLLDHGELCVCDLTEALALPQSKVSRHMSFLKKTGWVVSRRSGKWIYYSLAKPENPIQERVLNVLRDGLPQVLQAMKDYQCLCHYLETKSTEECD
ncbi:transcriptional regulator, ArsR family [Oleidesulfovibrio alaskensis G20]|jgi:ArsR family transcriptional regulator|uniref:Transcriptional regulator, ArsR family n=1 Tax=Oleidesulfovibrio alaskensis (strain ATCC BAA-1058 / DSM 17464 / G20) TaxID=207559 RepID=F9XXI8_OLEA2|nr:metalloregulator ArsR/SmtB family transcription factor [Oleidesulfovibrio alaskensis]AEL79451.1 transcriptional regulator, ArsR family [Oleidesulfovibrio alaskensis G20]